ncbi:MAG: FHA domain-containing protein [Ilumatobacteraceae bacterium]
MHDIALRLRLGDERRDVVVAVDDQHVGADLTRALTDATGLGPATRFTVARTGRPVELDSPIVDLDLLAGDELVVGGAAPPDRSPTRALALDVVAGPAAGESFVLRTGANTIGRSSSADCTVGDPTVSRIHATVSVSHTGDVELAIAPDASNGAIVDGTPARAGSTQPLAVGDVVVLGGTRIVIRRFERQPDDGRDRLGQLAFHRTPYRPPVVHPAEVPPIGPIPTRPEPRHLQFIAVLAPLIAGVAMFLLTGQAMFLLFTLISPVVMVGTAIDDRRSGRRSFTDDLDAFHDMLRRRRAELDAVAATEARRRHEASPDVADLARRAALRTIDLWERGRDAPDVLHLRLGLGDDRASFAIALEPGGDADLRHEAERAVRGADLLASVPVCHPLAERHLAVHGDPVLVDGVAASIVLHTAALHSPDDVAIALAVAPVRHLGWAKWLPHLRAVTSPLAGTHLATDTAGADDLIARLIDVVDHRNERSGPGRPVRWPRIVVVLDAALRPDATAVARLLDASIDVGISVVWLADRAAEVPRQAGGILAVSHADGAHASPGDSGRPIPTSPIGSRTRSSTRVAERSGRWRSSRRLDVVDGHSDPAHRAVVRRRRDADPRIGGVVVVVLDRTAAVRDRRRRRRTRRTRPRRGRTTHPDRWDVRIGKRASYSSRWSPPSRSGIHRRDSTSCSSTTKGGASSRAFERLPTQSVPSRTCRPTSLIAGVAPRRTRATHDAARGAGERPRRVARAIRRRHRRRSSSWSTSSRPW